MSLFSWFTNLFKKKKPAPAPVPAPVPTPVPTPVVKQPTFVENFTTLDSAKWTTSNWVASGNTATNKSSFQLSGAFIQNGMLCLKLSQIKNADGTFTSVGGEITSIQKFGYGTYEFEAKASSDSSDPTTAGNAISGSITGLFSYISNSLTEIDVEVEGGVRSPIVQWTSWMMDTKPNEHTVTSSLTPPPHAAFRKYKYIWTPTDISFFIDGLQVSKHTTVIPSTPAFFIFNHYGTNDDSWGGLATPGVNRYLFVKNFTFTAA